MTYTADRRLYLASDGTTVVEDGDERAAVLIAVAGTELSDEEAQRYGLSRSSPKARSAPPATKQVKSSPENKGT